MPTSLSPDDVLRLVANHELEAFCRSLGIKEAADIQRKDLARKIANYSRTVVLGALIDVNGIWIRMMKDILSILDKHGVSCRTTGCIIALHLNGKHTRLDMSPQLVNLIANFDQSTYTPEQFLDWDHAYARWENHVRFWINGLVREGEPVHRLELNRRYLALGAYMYSSVTRVDPGGINKVLTIWRTLDYLAAKLKHVDDRVSPAAAGRLSNEVIDCARDIGWKIKRWMCDSEAIQMHVDNVQPWSEKLTTQELFNDEWWESDEQWEEWKHFVEDVLSLARLESSRDLSDLLRLDTLKDGPRLFELWCMCKVLGMYSAMGYIVKLLSLTVGESPIWNLSYARASKPVARIEANGNQWWLFFQLYRRGSSRANMPDLALLRGREPSSAVMWIADPKYSEAAGYGRADYLEVAERYRDTFQAERVWICEFFTRREWFGGACFEEGEKFAVVSEVQPGGEGTRVLKRELGLLHRIASNRIVVAIDCSDSFAGMLPPLAAGLEVLLDAAEAVVCFAESAREIFGRDFGAVEKVAKELGHGTRLFPLVATLRALSVRNPDNTDLVLVSDEAFSDLTNELGNELQRLFAHTRTAKDDASMQETVAALRLA